MPTTRRTQTQRHTEEPHNLKLELHDHFGDVCVCVCDADRRSLSSALKQNYADGTTKFKDGTQQTVCVCVRDG